MAHIQDMPTSPLSSFLNQTDHNSYASDNPSSSVASDTIKFLRFAGIIICVNFYFSFQIQKNLVYMKLLKEKCLIFSGVKTNFRKIPHFIF